VESSKENADPIQTISTARVWTIRRENAVDLFKVMKVRRLSGKVPSSKLSAHDLSRYIPLILEVALSRLLAPVQNRIYFWHVWFIVDDNPTHLDPGVTPERDLRRTNHQECRYTLVFQEASRRRGALQTQCFFPIPDTGDVHRAANLFN
jgi:hypothetical protein